MTKLHFKPDQNKHIWRHTLSKRILNHNDVADRRKPGSINFLSISANPTYPKQAPGLREA